MSNSTSTRTIEIINELGLHLRPLAKFVAISERYTGCELKVSHDGITVNGKSIVGMMMLAAGKGSVLELIASGPNAEQMLDELAALAKDKFGE
jgi:phosphocarrier protein